MENLVGLFTDGKEVNAPYGSWAYAKNILINEGYKSIANEYGFDIDVQTPYPIIGVVPTNKGMVLFTTNNTLSSIHYVDETRTLNDIVLEDADLNFRFDFPIEGVFKFNNLNQLIVAFTDNINEPRVINITLTTSGTFGGINTIALFPETTSAVIEETVVENSGNLLSGAYFITSKKVTKSGIQTQWEETRRPLHITDSNLNVGASNYDGVEASTITNKSILLNIEHNGGTDFVTIKIGVLTKIAGVLTFYDYGDYPIESGIDITVSITTLNNALTLDISELLVKKAIYTKAKTIESLSEDLYLGNVSKEGKINYQKYANNIKLGWALRMRDVVSLSAGGTSKLNQDGAHVYKTFMPREVYNFYIVFELIKGGLSEFYHIPGLALQAFDEQEVTYTNTGFTASVDMPLEYQVGDSGTSLNTYDSGTGFGYGTQLAAWKNKNQVYTKQSADDDTTEVWDAGGIISDLDGENVRFHKFPSSRAISQSFISGGTYADADYGVSKRETLGLTWYDVYIPDDIKALIKGYKFAYAKRDTDDITIIGNDYLHYVAKENVGAGEHFNAGFNNPYNGATADWGMQPEYISGNCQDLIKTKLSVSPSCLINEYVVNIDLNTTFNIEKDTNNNSAVVDLTEDIFTSIPSTVVLTATDGATTLKKILDFRYIPNDIRITGLGSTVMNLNHYSKQESIFMEVGDNDNIITSLTSISDVTNGAGSSKNFSDTVTAYYSMLVLKDDIYQDYKTLSNFILDDLLIDKDEVDSSNILDAGRWFGDCFTCVSSHIQHCAIIDSSYPTDKVTVNSTNPHFIIYAYTTISANNWGLRHKTSDVLTSYYPKYYSNINRTNNPGYYNWLNEYNDDYTSLNEIIGTADNFQNKTQDSFPYRIAIGNHTGIDNDFDINWADFLANNFYEMLDRNKGEIWKIIKSDEALLIYQKYSLSIARVKDSLLTSVDTVYLGQGSIFDRKPNEVLPTNQGYVGNQSQWATLICPLGVVSLDRSTGKVFIFNGQLNEISNSGMYNYFRDNLQTTDVNVDNPFLYNGLSMTYDGRYKRLILSKRNLVFIANGGAFTETDGIEELDPLPINIFYRGAYYVLKAGDVPPDTFGVQPANLLALALYGELIDIEDETKFRNESKTISYSPILNNNNGGWVCWHDYYPCYMFFDRNKTYAVRNNLDGGTVYSMNSLTSKSSFYDTLIYPSYFDFIFNTRSDISKTQNVVMWDTDAVDLDDITTKVKEDTTFTHIMIYNNNQCSGLITLVKSPYLRKLLRNNKEKWSFNEFRDMVKVSSSAFLDENKQIISTNIATKKAFYNKNLFLGKFIVVRFYNDNVLQVDLNVNSVSTNLKAIENE